MKLTWFGGRTLRVHIGGRILVANADVTLSGIDRVELESGADRVFVFPDKAAKVLDFAAWKPQRRASMLDGDDADVRVGHANTAVLVDAVGEPPLVLVDGAPPEMGRWAQDAVVVLFGDRASLLKTGEALLADSAPRLLMLAGEPEAVSAAFEGLREGLDGTGLVALEKGMAVEV
jgi:hypothetical protein